MSDTQQLPEADSEEIAALVGSTTQRLLYGFLYRRRDNPPTMIELRFFVSDALGEEQASTERRLRELRRYFDIEAVEIDSESRYRLHRWSATRPPHAGVAISPRRRAEVLAPQRCAQCGRTPLESHVKLVVDNKVPLSWGGDNEPENLQPFCEECYAGKRDYFRSFEAYAEQIRDSNWLRRTAETHRRAAQSVRGRVGSLGPTRHRCQRQELPGGLATPTARPAISRLGLST